VNFTIIGMGNMARGIATRLLSGGNAVTLVGTGNSKAQGLAAELGGQATAAATGGAIRDEVVVLAVPYGAVAGVL
jgi:predicted dinucleotide-binding enzyme